jgi:hypothetical protein
MGTVPRNPDYQLPANRTIQKFAFHSAGQMMIEGDADPDSVAAGFLAHPGINRLKSPVFGNDQFMVFPNFSMHITINGWWWTTYWPLTKGRALWRTTFFYKQPQSLREKFAINHAVALQRDIFAEDNLCFQKQQAMLESGGKPFIQFGEQEILCRHLVAVISGIAKQTHPEDGYQIAAE